MIGERLSHYDILEELGKGGMGVVYRARDTHLLREVAIKVLSSEGTSENQKKRFIQEARAASALNHSGIVGIYDFGHDKGVDFIVMEYVKGKSLARKISSGPLPVGEVVRYAKQIAGAMATAHAAGIIHRDLKPHNLMITEHGQVKILDFGIAKLNPIADFDRASDEVPTALTGYGHVIGTLEYMSPEQAVGEQVDARSDIFSFGVVLYEMLAGARPFKGDSEASLMQQLHFDMPAPLASIREDVPAQVSRIIEKAMAKRPKDRHQSMNEVVAELNALAVRTETMDKPPVMIGPVQAPKTSRTSGSGASATLSRVFMKLAERPKRSLAGLVVVILALVAASTYGLIVRMQPDELPKPPVLENHLLVLPFENLDKDKSLEKTCTGLTESLTTGLSQVKELKGKLKIIPAAEVRQSNVRSAKEARDQFGAGLVIACSLQRVEKAIQMNVSLIRGTTQLGAATGVVREEEKGSLQRQAMLKAVGLLRQRFGQSSQTPARVADSSNDSSYKLFRQGMEYVSEFNRPGNVDKAIKAFQQALTLDSNSAPAHAGLSRAYWRKYIANEDPMWLKQAVQTARRAVELNPDLGISRVSLGLALMQQGNNAEATQEFEQALAFDPFCADAMRGLADVWHARGDLKKAESFYQDALNLRPSDRELIDGLGNVYFHTSQYKKAEEMYLQSVKIAPDNFWGYNNLGAVYLVQGMHAEAATQFQRALEIKPSSALYGNLGTSYFFQGRYVDAVSAYKKAVELPGGANDYRLWANLADAYRWTPDNLPRANEAYQVAIRLLEKKLAQDPDNLVLNSRKALFQAKKGDFTDAEKTIRRFSKQNIHDPEIHYHFTVALELVGKRKAALKSLEKALSAGYSVEDIRTDPDLTGLRQDPGYHTLMVNVNIQKEEGTLQD